MAEVGILHEDDRVELIEGVIYIMAKITPYHASCKIRLNQLFSLSSIITKAICSVHNPITIDSLTEPVPDIALIKPRDNFYRDRHPIASEVYLLIEIADISFDYCRKMKIPIYCHYGVPESWLVDLEKEAIEIYTQPSETGYKTIQTLVPGDSLSPLAFPELTIAVEDILGSHSQSPQ